ncbi:MAG: helix-turn-helix domain-containing protein [Solirubrobacteraceae bacterium]
MGSWRAACPPSRGWTSRSAGAGCSRSAAPCSRHAYDELSMATIAREAGISKALLYHYLPSMQAFFVTTAAFHGWLWFPDAACLDWVATATSTERSCTRCWPGRCRGRSGRPANPRWPRASAHRRGAANRS